VTPVFLDESCGVVEERRPVPAGNRGTQLSEFVRAGMVAEGVQPRSRNESINVHNGCEVLRALAVPGRPQEVIAPLIVEPSAYAKAGYLPCIAASARGQGTSSNTPSGAMNVDVVSGLVDSGR
jgi:hypothetical protein